MLDALLLVLGGVAGIGSSIWLGLRWGERLRPQPRWRFWGVNALFMVSGVTVSFVGLQFVGFWLGVFGIGWVGGGMTGLKYGLGESVGVWRVLDDVTGSDELPRG